MYIKNRIVALIYRCVLIVVCGIGLYITTGLYRGSFSSNSLVYYTTLSNLLCFLFYILLIIRNAANLINGDKAVRMLLPRLKGAFTLMITITMIVYHFMLAGLYADGDFSFYLQNLILHYIVPSMVIFDWILFDPKRTFHSLDPLYWLSIPILYSAFSLIRAEIGGMLPGRTTRYPYFFLDIDEIGWGGVLTYVALFALVFAILGYLIWALDRFVFGMKKRGSRKNERNSA